MTSLTLGNVRRKIELCPKKTTSQQTELPGLTLKIFLSYQGLESQEHSLGKGLSYSGFSFYEHFNRQFTYAAFFIQNRKMC